MNERIEKIINNLPEEAKEKIKKDAITWFECKRSNTIPYCKCGKNKTETKCEYPLMGSKEGQFCNKLLCKSCGTLIDDKYYCRAHTKMVQS